MMSTPPLRMRYETEKNVERTRELNLKEIVELGRREKYTSSTKFDFEIFGTMHYFRGTIFSPIFGLWLSTEYSVRYLPTATCTCTCMLFSL